MDHLRRMPPGVVIVAGAVIGLAFGIVVGVTMNVSFAPEAGAALGGVVGWLLTRNRA